MDCYSRCSWNLLFSWRRSEILETVDIGRPSESNLGGWVGLDLAGLANVASHPGRGSMVLGFSRDEVKSL